MAIEGIPIIKKTIPKLKVGRPGRYVTKTFIKEVAKKELENSVYGIMQKLLNSYKVAAIGHTKFYRKVYYNESKQFEWLEEKDPQKILELLNTKEEGEDYYTQ